MTTQLKLQKQDFRFIFSASSILCLRMLGLFMVLPLFAIYANQLTDANATRVGIAIGIYGLTQAFCQFPFGALSDYFGRKPIIVSGLLLFIAGSLIAAFAKSIFIMMLGRAVQGMGAIGSTTLALLSDTIPEKKRGSAMALVGACIGLSFILALWLGPLLATQIKVRGLFFCAALFGVFAIFILLTQFSHLPEIHNTSSTQHTNRLPLFSLLKQGELLRLSIGVFFLHAIFTANFTLIPFSLFQMHSSPMSEWKIYFYALCIALVVSLFSIRFAEKNNVVRLFFQSAIIFIFLAEFGFAVFLHSPWQAIIYLSLFFSGFTYLEAMQPALVSRIAPAHQKGSALGIYSFLQFFGIFAGGIFGGWLKAYLSFPWIYLCLASIALLWLAINHHFPTTPPLRKTSPN